MARSFHALDGLPAPFDLIDERVIFIPPGATLVTHNPGFKILLFFEAEVRMEVERGGGCEIASGDVMVVPRACVQEYFPIHSGRESRLHVARLLLSTDAAASGAEMVKGGTFGGPNGGMDELLRGAFSGVAHMPGAMKGDLGERAKDLFREIEDQHLGYPLAAYGMLIELVVKIIRYHRRLRTNDAERPVKRADEIASQTKAYLAENFDRAIHLKDVAWHLRLSEEHLARVFRERTGETVAASVRRMRIDKARRLLLSSNESMTNIARACGFRSLPVFSVNFTKQAGVGPSEYRRLHTPKIRYPGSNLKWSRNRGES